MINDYEERFQRSVEKLPIPKWFTVDPNVSSNSRYSSKQSITWNGPMTEAINRQARTYRSCRSSLATSPSPSVHSCYPNILVDRRNSTSRNVSRSCSRRARNYEKGIERVSKSSQWYRPMNFALPENQCSQGDQISGEVSSMVVTSGDEHYDIPKVSSTCPPCSMINDDSVKPTNDVDVIQENKESFEVNPTREMKQIPSIESIDLNLNEVKLSENDFQRKIDEQNIGVRELSDDDHVLRELDENEINDTDEFFVFAAEIDDRNSLATNNRLYTFRKFTEQDKRQSAEINKHVETMNLLSDDCFPEDQKIESLINQSSNGVDEETVRIGRILLESISNSTKIQSPSTFDDRWKQTSILDQTLILENDDEFLEDTHHDSGYSSNHERFPLSNGGYERLFDCLSGNVSLTTEFVGGNISSITDEAYESEPTTMSSSIRTNVAGVHVHPDLEHEFEYPSPPPPVPDRRLKPEHFRPSRKLVEQEKSRIPTKNFAENFLGTIKNEINAKPVQLVNSRDYCGSIPANKSFVCRNEGSQSNVENRTKKTKRMSGHFNCLHPVVDRDDNSGKTTWIKSSTSTSKGKQQKASKRSTDELSNGLAIRFTATNFNKSNGEKTNNSRKTGQNIGTTKTSTKSPIYETSV